MVDSWYIHHIILRLGLGEESTVFSDLNISLTLHSAYLMKIKHQSFSIISALKRPDHFCKPDNIFNMGSWAFITAWRQWQCAFDPLRYLSKAHSLTEMMRMNWVIVRDENAWKRNEKQKGSIVDDYIKQLPETIRIKLEEIRKITQAAAPGAEERISSGKTWLLWQLRCSVKSSHSWKSSCPSPPSHKRSGISGYSPTDIILKSWSTKATTKVRSSTYMDRRLIP